MSDMSDTKVSLEGINVMAGIPSMRNPGWKTVMSLMATQRACDAARIPFAPMIINCGHLPKCRDGVLKEFLDSDATVLFWIDDDMEWRAEHFLRFLALSQIYDVVTAAYPAKVEPLTYYADMPTSFNLNEHGLISISGMGLGFTAVRREPLERLAAQSPDVFDQLSNSFYKQVFRCDVFDGKFRSEDMAFFADLKDLGYEVWLDPSIDLIHHGGKAYSGNFMSMLKLDQQPEPELALA